MSAPDTRDDERREERAPRDERRDERRDRSGSPEDSVELVATSTVRVGFLALGFLILLYAVGQILGVDVLGMMSEVLDTREVRWMIVAFFGVVLITLALRGFRSREPR